jgi:hypothetical protein
MQPQSPNPKFDFMLKDQAQPKRGLALPGGNLIKILVIAIVAVMLLVIISSILRGNKGGPQAMVPLLARETEIIRVTGLAQDGQPALQDPGTQALAATVATSLASQQQQITSYLSKNHVKPSKLQLATDTDKSMDSQLQAAGQNNTLDATYISYLKSGMASYQQELQTAYDKAGLNGKAIIKDAFDSTKTLLDNPPLKS